jgi:hypothetical protein
MNIGLVGRRGWTIPGLARLWKTFAPAGHYPLALLDLSLPEPNPEVL